MPASLLNGPLAEVEQGLLDSLECQVPTVRELGRHVFGSGGKRMRPRMALMACALVGYEEKSRFDLACAFELIHTATLIHDDIVDNSDHRRKRLSANALWSNATAVLSGDYLYSRAFELLTASGNTGLLRYVSRITNRLAQGELMQLEHIKNPALGEAAYFAVIRHKTAYLFEACAHSVSYLTELDAELSEALRLFGLTFGEAFQIRDDYLDYRGGLDTIGKEPGGDLRDGKPTLPIIHALANCGDGREREALARAIREPEADGGNFAAVSGIIEANGGFGRTLDELNRRLGELDDLVERLSAHAVDQECADELRQLCRRLPVSD